MCIRDRTKTGNNKFTTLTYNNHTEKIAHKFKKAGYRIAYKTTNKTEHTLSKHTHKAQNKFDLPGDVYKRQVHKCGNVTTRRPFNYPSRPGTLG